MKDKKYLITNMEGDTYWNFEKDKIIEGSQKLFISNKIPKSLEKINENEYRMRVFCSSTIGPNPKISNEVFEHYRIISSEESKFYEILDKEKQRIENERFHIKIELGNLENQLSYISDNSK